MVRSSSLQFRDQMATLVAGPPEDGVQGSARVVVFRDSEHLMIYGNSLLMAAFVLLVVGMASAQDPLVAGAPRTPPHPPTATALTRRAEVAAHQKRASSGDA